MANKKISELPSAGALTGAELVESVQGGINKQTTTQDIANLGGGGSVTSVSGTTNRITSTGGATPVIDIDAAYDAIVAAKAPIASPTFTGTPAAPTAAAGTNTTQVATTAFVNTEIAADAPRGLSMVAATGAVISFAIPQYYGSAAAITGNITFSTTGAVLGMEQVMRHNDATEPSFPSEFKRMVGSRSYVPSVDNFIYCKYLSATKIQYTINQEQ